jgi:hypothetical protein
VTQGEQPALLWKSLMAAGAHINFGIPTFKWVNEAKGKAAVFCVIIGFSEEKTDNDLNQYLLKAPVIFIESRQHPLCDVPEIGIGNQPIDGGNYLFTESEKTEFLLKEPQAAKWFRPWIGADEFINGYTRHCLFLRDCPINELRKMSKVMLLVESVQKYRLASVRKNTLKLANTPIRFQTENIPNSKYIIVPEVSSDKRTYIPIGFLSPDILASNLVKIIPNATLYHFGILTSIVHMAWVRAVCGRLGTGYRYSKDIVYNNFPLPDVTEKQELETAKVAHAILDVRKYFEPASLADLYDPLTMPPELLKAHQALDRAVMKLYEIPPDTAEPEIVAALMQRYQNLTANTTIF